MTLTHTCVHVSQVCMHNHPLVIKLMIIFICRLLGVLILLAEAAFIITEVYFVNFDQRQHTVDIFQVLDLIFSAYYSVEVTLRIIGNG